MTAPPPTVSVILPTHNRAPLLRRAVASVVAQSWLDWELIVVDDASTQDIPGLMKGIDDRIRVIRRDCRGGAAAARNSGVAAARGEWIAFQDSDDEWLPHKLHVQLEAVRDPGHRFEMVIGTMVRILGTAVRVHPGRDLLTARTMRTRDVLSRPVAYSQTWLLRRDLLDRAGRFNERLRVWDDWELLIRLSRQGTIGLLDSPVAVSHQQTDGLSADRTRFIHDLDLILRLHAGLLDTDAGTSARLHLLLGRRMAREGDRAGALRVLRQAIRRDPSLAQAWILWLGACLSPSATSAILGWFNARQTTSR